ncbi:type I-E CRISPR-associated protein Cse1/CasA [Rothia sp. CCM 9418]|uniref:type I-E CRISPR-associated protein Cse1/CasA n=1 Tax=Rothia sp. CCM 9418 TaxID=3402661 RepID=UPI003AEC6CDD
MVNALRDVSFVKLDTGYVTVREALLKAHLPETTLDMKVPGYEYGAVLRLLSTVAAVSLRYCGFDSFKKTKKISSKLITDGIPEEALDKALKDLEPGSFVFDDITPFMQYKWVELDEQSVIGLQKKREKGPAAKLNPTLPSLEREEFWNLKDVRRSELSLPEAIMGILVYCNYSMAGNSKHEGRKCSMGSPAIHFVETGNTATEMFWQGSSLLATLLMSIPKSWVFSEELPAWADREGKTKAKTPSAEPSLWDATWSSNTVTTYWNDKKLVGVELGGIPENWYLPEMGSANDKQARKNWWDTRNTLDPFYLYLPDDKGKPKIQSLDLSKDATELAVEWASKAHLKNAADGLQTNRIYGGTGKEKLCFLRHQIEGTASSASIRASSVYRPDSKQWVFDLSEDLQREIRNHAKTTYTLHEIVCFPFRRNEGKGKNSRKVGKTVVIFDDLEHRKKDTSAYFWREIAPVYEGFVKTAKRGEREIPQDLLEAAYVATLRAYDKTVAPHLSQHPGRIAYIRADLKRRLHTALFPQK